MNDCVHGSFFISSDKQICDMCRFFLCFFGLCCCIINVYWKRGQNGCVEFWGFYGVKSHWWNIRLKCLYGYVKSFIAWESGGKSSIHVKWKLERKNDQKCSRTSWMGEEPSCDAKKSKGKIECLNLFIHLFSWEAIQRHYSTNRTRLL